MQVALDYSNRGHENWLESEYLLKVESVGFAARIDMGIRETKLDSKISYLLRSGRLWK